MPLGPSNDARKSALWMLCAAAWYPQIWGGHAEMKAVSEKHPMGMCQHFIAALRIDDMEPAVADGDDISGFYSGMGLVLLGAVVDGDCGIDVMCQMLSRPHNSEQSLRMRAEIADFIIDRANARWFQDVMACCQEISQEDVTLHWSHTPGVSESAVAGGSAVAACPSESADAETPREITDQQLMALSWASSLDDHAQLVSLARALPEAVVLEQVANYAASQVAVAAPPEEPGKILVHSDMAKSRMQVAESFDKYLRADGWAPGNRIPRNACPQFIDTMLSFPLKSRARDNRRNLVIWHNKWRKETRLQIREARGRLTSLTLTKWNPQLRKMTVGQGRPPKCPWLRKTLYEWFAMMRYSIDWKSVIRSCGVSSCGQR